MQNNRETNSKRMIMRRKVIIDNFRGELDEITKGLTDDEIMDLVRDTVWKVEGTEVLFVDEAKRSPSDARLHTSPWIGARMKRIQNEEAPI